MATAIFHSSELAAGSGGGGEPPPFSRSLGNPVRLAPGVPVLRDLGGFSSEAPLTYRLLPPEEWPKLKAVFHENGSELLDPVASIILVAEEAGKIVGMHVLQLFGRIGPMWIAESHRARGVWREMFSRLDDYVMGTGSGYFMFTRDPKTEHMAQGMGMKETGWKVWLKEPKE